MNEKDKTKISKMLSLVLRHDPQQINIELDENGWTDTDELMTQLNKHGFNVNFDLLDEVVATNDKQRFAFNDDLTKIRANQGHSVQVDLSLIAVAPPPLLYHGTVAKFIEAIRQTGLQKMSRQHVHLSKGIETAQKVGSRSGTPIILIIAANQMAMDGYLFYLSKNSVWLCDNIPAKYINF